MLNYLPIPQTAGADGKDHLAQSRAGGVVVNRETPLVVLTDLSAETQDESSLGRLLQVP
ncbi:hypothetical protein LCGC14_3160740, partial [marine sediment metagenome]